MAEPPQLFDQTLLSLRQSRARALIDGADFLHRAVFQQISERLSEVNRDFTAPALVTRFPEMWRQFCNETATPSHNPRLTSTVVEDRPVLTLDESSCDLAIHVLGLHWSNDPLGALIQMRRALRPDGMMLAAVFGGRTLWELREAWMLAETEVLGGITPRVAPMGELRDLGNLLGRAGFALPVADSDTITVRYGSPITLMTDLRAMGESNAMIDRHKVFVGRHLLARVVEIYAERFAGEDGRVPATFEIAWLTGWAPATSQPQPLRPGSATARLADALGTLERPTGDRVLRPGNDTPDPKD